MGRWQDNAEPFRKSLEKSNLDGVRDLVLLILEKYPPAEFYYVALGRSPTPLTAFLEACGVGEVATVPLSKLKYADFPSQEVNAKRAYVQKHTMKHIPVEPLKTGKKLLVIDFVDFGESLFIGRNVIENALRSHNFSNEVKAVGLAYDFDKGQISRFQNQFGYELFNVPDRTGLDLYHKKFKEIWSRYDEWRVDTLNKADSVPDVVERPEYLELMKVFAAYIKAAPDLIKKLAKHLGD